MVVFCYFFQLSVAFLICCSALSKVISKRSSAQKYEYVDWFVADISSCSPFSEKESQFTCLLLQLLPSLRWFSILFTAPYCRWSGVWVYELLLVKCEVYSRIAWENSFDNVLVEVDLDFMITLITGDPLFPSFAWTFVGMSKLLHVSEGVHLCGRRSCPCLAMLCNWGSLICCTSWFHLAASSWSYSVLSWPKLFSVLFYLGKRLAVN